MSSYHQCALLRLRISILATSSSARRPRCAASALANAPLSLKSSSAFTNEPVVSAVGRASLHRCCHALTKTAMTTAANAARKAARCSALRGNAFVELAASALGPTSRSKRRRRSFAGSRLACRESNGKSSRRLAKERTYFLSSGYPRGPNGCVGSVRAKFLRYATRSASAPLGFDTSD